MYESLQIEGQVDLKNGERSGEGSVRQSRRQRGSRTGLEVTVIQ